MPEPLARVVLARAPSGVRVCAGSGAELAAALSAIVDGALRERAETAHREGLAAGDAAALEAAAGALHEAGARLDAAREEACSELARTAVQLAVEIARCLVHAEIETGRYDLEQMVRETLAVSGTGRGHCTIHLNPTDAEALAGHTFRAGTEIEADVEVPRGHVHVSTPQGLLVRDPEEALVTIAERIFGELR